MRNLDSALAEAPDVHGIDDPQFREQVARLKRRRAEFQGTIPTLQQRLSAGVPKISDETIATFWNAIRKRLRDADPAFRGQWLHLFVDEVIIGRSEILISGRNDSLLKGVTRQADFFAPAVPSFDREWRTRHDSNVRPLPSEGSALSS